MCAQEAAKPVECVTTHAKEGGVTNVEHTKATPGPWEVITVNGQLAVANTEIKFLVAVLHPDDTETDGPANAALIASAPALVAAVERVQALHTPICEHSGTNCKSPICPMLVCQSCGDDYPCDTRKALETP